MQACLILVDLQDDFLAHPSLRPDAAEVIHNVSRLLEIWRKNNLPVAHVRTLVDADTDDRMPHWKQQNTWICIDGTPGAGPPGELEALPDEPVFAKSFFSPFQNNDFDQYLRSHAELLIVVGLYTHSCIRETVLGAYQEGYRVWVVSDCIGSYDPLHASLTRDYLQDRACHFLTVSETVQRLGLQPHQAHHTTPPAAPLYINGQWMASDSTKIWRHLDPCNSSESLHLVTIGSRKDVDLAARAAAAFQPQWHRDSSSKGLELLRSWLDLLILKRTAIVSLIMREIGKPSSDAEAEFSYMLALLHATISRPRNDDLEKLANAVQIRQHPLGVVGLITPWNNPLAIPVGKIAPALLHGNTVIWKPALQSYALPKVVLETLTEAGFPKDCVNVVLGDAQTGKDVVLHPLVSGISFTGSVAAGRIIGAHCVSRGKVLQAELGGNNGVVVGACDDLRRAADDLAQMAFSFAGQRCTAPRRVLVGDRQYEDFLDHFLERVGALRIGSPVDPDTQVGPMISLERRADVISKIEQSIRQGGRVLCGGGIPDNWQAGCWIQPTVIEPSSQRDDIVQEESFGPIVVVQRAKNFESAVALCNDVSHGLVASLFSDDKKEKQYFSAQAQAGILRINEIRNSIHPEAPFGGWKASGIGLPEHGYWDDMFYTRPQAVYSQ